MRLFTVLLLSTLPGCFGMHERAGDGSSPRSPLDSGPLAFVDGGSPPITMSCVDSGYTGNGGCNTLEQIDAGPQSPPPPDGVDVALVASPSWTLAPGETAFADFDGDGLDDIVLGSHDTPFGGSVASNASVIVVYGRRGGLRGTYSLDVPDAQLFGDTDEPGQRSERAMATGDFDGDGIDDIALATAGTVTEGTVIIAFGRRARVTGAGGIDGLGLRLRLFRTVREIALSRAGDLDGDGIDDLFVRVVEQDDTVHLFVLHGNADHGPDTDRAFAPDTTFRVTASTVTLGLGTAAGDLDGDGHDDALVVLTDDVRNEVRVLYGPFTGRDVSIEMAAARVPTAADFGGMLGGFDANGDGLSDFAVSTATADGDAVAVFFGSRRRLAGTVSLSDAAAILTAASADARLDTAIAAGDVDGDGRSDLLLGSPGFEGGAGRTDRVLGPPTTRSLGAADRSWIGGNPSDASGLHWGQALGAGVAQNGDFDGDGHADALFSAPTVFAPEPFDTVYLVYGSTR